VARHAGTGPLVSMAGGRPPPGATAIDTRRLPKGGEGEAVPGARSAEVVKVVEPVTWSPAQDKRSGGLP
jgi:hypothetical protein